MILTEKGGRHDIIRQTNNAMHPTMIILFSFQCTYPLGSSSSVKIQQHDAIGGLSLPVKRKAKKPLLNRHHKLTKFNSASAPASTCASPARSEVDSFSDMPTYQELKASTVNLHSMPDQLPCVPEFITTSQDQPSCMPEINATSQVTISVATVDQISCTPKIDSTCASPSRSRVDSFSVVQPHEELETSTGNLQAIPENSSCMPEIITSHEANSVSAVSPISCQPEMDITCASPLRSGVDSFSVIQTHPESETSAGNLQTRPEQPPCVHEIIATSQEEKSAATVNQISGKPEMDSTCANTLRSGVDSFSGITTCPELTTETVNLQARPEQPPCEHEIIATSQEAKSIPQVSQISCDPEMDSNVAILSGLETTASDIVTASEATTDIPSVDEMGSVLPAAVDLEQNHSSLNQNGINSEPNFASPCSAEVGLDPTPAKVEDELASLSKASVNPNVMTKLKELISYVNKSIDPGQLRSPAQSQTVNTISADSKVQCADSPKAKDDMNPTSETTPESLDRTSPNPHQKDHVMTEKESTKTETEQTSLTPVSVGLEINHCSISNAPVCTNQSPSPAGICGMVKNPTESAIENTVPIRAPVSTNEIPMEDKAENITLVSSASTDKCITVVSLPGTPPKEIASADKLENPTANSSSPESVVSIAKQNSTESKMDSIVPAIKAPEIDVPVLEDTLDKNNCDFVEIPVERSFKKASSVPNMEIDPHPVSLDVAISETDSKILSPVLPVRKETGKNLLTTGLKYIHWLNKDALCWLDVAMAILVHSYTVRKLIKDIQSCDNLVKGIVKSFDVAQQILNVPIPGKMIHLETSVGKVNVKTGGGEVSPKRLTRPTWKHAKVNQKPQILIEQPRVQPEVLQKIDESKKGEAYAILDISREVVWQRLQPKLKCQKGDHDSPVFALPLIIRESAPLMQTFMVHYGWEMTCTECGYEHTDR